MKKIIYRHRIFFRAFLVTAFMLLCVSTVVTACGYVYTVVEHNAFGRNVTAFSATSKDYVKIFGREFYLPVVSVHESVSGFIVKYCSGTIKLLGFAINTAEELINKIINLI